MPEDENCQFCGYPGNGEKLVKTARAGMYNCCEEELMAKLRPICESARLDFDEYAGPFLALFRAAKALKGST
jgi:hypothetical protein